MMQCNELVKTLLPDAGAQHRSAVGVPSCNLIIAAAHALAMACECALACPDSNDVLVAECKCSAGPVS